MNDPILHSRSFPWQTAVPHVGQVLTRVRPDGGGLCGAHRVDTEPGQDQEHRTGTGGQQGTHSKADKTLIPSRLPPGLGISHTGTGLQGPVALHPRFPTSCCSRGPGPARLHLHRGKGPRPGASRGCPRTGRPPATEPSTYMQQGTPSPQGPSRCCWGF